MQKVAPKYGIPSDNCDIMNRKLSKIRILLSGIILSSPLLMRAGGEVSDSLYQTLDEVDVVAAKYDSDYRSSAVAGTAITRNRSERLGIVDAKGLSSIVPNFHIPDYGSRITSSIYVRGIGARMDQPAVGLTVDNISVLNKDAYDFDIADIASMEMLRGPQSTLFGRNTMTGLINIRTLSPFDFSGWRGKVELGLNSLFRFNIGWYHKFRYNSGLAIVGSFYRFGGEFKNVYNNLPVDREVSGSLRIKFNWNPTDRVGITNTFTSSMLRQGGYAYENVATGQINYNDTCFYRRFILNDGLTVNHKIGDLTLVSVTTLQHINDNMTLDQDFLPEPYFTLTQKKNETSVSEDVMLKGFAFDNKYRWLTGVYAFYRHLNMTAPVTFKDEGIKTLIESHRNEVNPRYPIRWDERQFVLGSDFRLPSGGLAVYHESQYKFSGWTFRLGLRLDYEHVGMHYWNECNTSYTVYDNPTGVLPPADNLEPYRRVPVDLTGEGKLSHDYLQFLPKLSVIKELPALEGGNVYLTVGKGYKAGGFNTQMFSDVLQQRLMEFMGLSGGYDVDDIVSYKPEQSWNFEIGSHLNFFDSKIKTDISLFYIYCRDQQMTVFPEGQTTGRMTTNAGRTLSFGGELSVYATPLPGFNIMATYGYTNARFTNFINGNNNYKGKRLPYAPSNTLFAEASYRIDVSTTGHNYIDAGINFTGTGDIYWNEENTLRQNFYGLLGATISYNTSRWSVELFGRNLTQTKFYTFYFMSMGNEFRQKGSSMKLGVVLRAKF